MRRAWNDVDAGDDGHPCEAALEFRRQIVIGGLAEDLSAETIHLCTAAAWIGKAVSRTVECAVLLEMGVDPNCWEMIAAMATSSGFARSSVDWARSSRSAPGRGAELAVIRSGEGFRGSCDLMEQALAVVGRMPARRRWMNLGAIAGGLGRPRVFHVGGNVVDIRAAHRRNRP